MFLLNVSPCWSKFRPTRAHHYVKIGKSVFPALIFLLRNPEDSLCTRTFPTLRFVVRSTLQKGLIASTPVEFDVLGSLLLDCSRGELVSASKLIIDRDFRKKAA